MKFHFFSNLEKKQSMRDQLFLFLVIILLTFQKDLSAQAYRPMAVEGATWEYHGWGDNEGRVIRYFIEGDSIINNTSYKVVHESLSFSGAGGTMLIRDDSINRKVYAIGTNPIIGTCHEVDSLINNHWDKEFLLLDFDVEVGQSMDLCIFGDYNYNINSISYENLFGESLRCISDQDTIRYSSDINIIEGIGSPDGFLGSLGLFIASGEGFGLTEYCISDNGVCTTATRNPLDHSEIKVYPNPSSDIVNITTEKTTLSTSIYDLNGRRLLHNQNQKIDLSPLNPGPYLIEVILSDQYVYRTKIIKI